MNSSTRLPYTPGLGNIRALAVLAVLCYHANYSQTGGRFLGVEDVFVRSGFLITLLLLSAWQAKGGINLRNLWLRRARRLLPAVRLLLLILPLLAILFAHDAMQRLKEDPPALLVKAGQLVVSFILAELSYRYDTSATNFLTYSAGATLVIFHPPDPHGPKRYGDT